MRSLLIVRAAVDDLAQAMGTEADALVVELSDQPDAAVLAKVRDALAAGAADEMRPLVFVRLDAVDAPETDTVLAALMPAEPDGFLLGACAGGVDVQHLGAKLAVIEAEFDLADGQTGIIAAVGGVARGVLGLASFVGCSPRLLGLAWEPHAFAEELGLDLEDGEPAPSATARSLVVIAARAAAVAAITVWTDGDDADFRHTCAQARRDGFNACTARTPAEVTLVNAAFGG